MDRHPMSHLRSSPWKHTTHAFKERHPMNLTTLLLVVIVVILLGGGGFYFGR
jgi:hypothetical protein